MEETRLSWFDAAKLVTEPIINNLKLFSSYAKGQLLDVGCGSKPYLSILKDKVEIYIGLDLPSLYKEIDVYGSALEIPFRDRSFDTVLSTQVLEHVPEPSKMMGEIGRVIKPGGYLMLTAPQTARIHGEPHDYYRFTKYGLSYLAGENGFKVIHLSPHGGIWIAIGYLISFYIHLTLPKTKFCRKVAHILIAGVQLLCFIFEKIHTWNLDTTGYTLIAKRLEQKGT